MKTLLLHTSRLPPLYYSQLIHYPQEPAVGSKFIFTHLDNLVRTYDTTFGYWGRTILLHLLKLPELSIVFGVVLVFSQVVDDRCVSTRKNICYLLKCQTFIA